jgi:hypothetical protein
MLLVNMGYREDFIDAAILRALDVNIAKGKPLPQSIAWFVTVVKNALEDPDERQDIESLLAVRSATGISPGAPLTLMEKPIASKIAFIHAIVEEAARSGVAARVILAERVSR